MSLQKPKSITVRSYQVGFGDCILVIFKYQNNKNKHILIDFGSTARPKKENFKNENNIDLMLKVAEHIKETCEGELDAVVATHRHKDHISGFAPSGKKNNKGETRGDIIKSCSPKLTILPWTENPDLETDAEEPFRLSSKSEFEDNAEKSFASNLQSMSKVANSIFLETDLLSDNRFIQPISLADKDQLKFMGDNNLSNKKAVLNLIEMAKNGKGCYVHAEYDLQEDFDEVFPGVKVYVLGPPTIKQYPKVKSQRSKDKDEFWIQQALNKNFWAVQAATSQTISRDEEEKKTVRDTLFPDAASYEGHNIPPHTRWFIRRVRESRGNQLLQLVRILDKALNNTSVILLFEVGDKKLLFPGDAQIENWEYALGKDEFVELLKDTYLYKVGHHGSRNATPKTLWEYFDRKTKNKNNKDRLVSLLSTMHGKHGHKPETAVPRETLVNELDSKSTYRTTEEIKDIDTLFIDIDIKIDN